jgi:hypothetical protein
MNGMRFPSAEFDDTVAAVCDGRGGDYEVQRLHELLAADAAAQDEYLWRVELHGYLATAAIETGLLQAGGGPLQSSRGETPAWKQAAVWGRGSLLPPLAAVTLCLAVIASLAGWWQMPAPRPNSRVVARVGAVRNAHWMQPQAGLLAGALLKVGDRLELASGVVGIAFGSGAEMHVTGPAVVRLASDNSAALLLGQVRLRAETPASKGFVLATRDTSFVDIGTEFVATVNADGLSQLNVTEGEVDVVWGETGAASRVRAGETVFVEPGTSRVITRIERGEETAAFAFPAIPPPSDSDAADQSQGSAVFQVLRGRLKQQSGSPALLGDGAGQLRADSPRESTFFQDHSWGTLLVDLGRDVNVAVINSYSWHQHRAMEEHRERARQRYTVFGWAGNGSPDLKKAPEQEGWIRIARVNTDKFFDVHDRLDRPAQQAVSITSADGRLGEYRYLLFEVFGHTLFGEIDVHAVPAVSASSVEGR